MSTSDNRVLPDTASSTSNRNKINPDTTVQSDAATPAKPEDSEHFDADIGQTGSLDLGKHRQKDAPVSTDPEKHVTPHSPSKEFHFPKSN